MWIVIVIAVIVIGLVGVIAMQPAEFQLQRSATMAAPPSAVFELVNDFHNWSVWSPWEKLDPELQRNYEGPSSGAGAVYSWVGNNQVGQGRMTITESRPPELILIELEFLRPMKAINVTEFKFEPVGDQTRVTWSMTGRNGFMGKAFGLFMNMEKIVGGQFEEGLASMKAAAESGQA